MDAQERGVLWAIRREEGRYGPFPPEIHIPVLKGMTLARVLIVGRVPPHEFEPMIRDQLQLAYRDYMCSRYPA